MMCASKRALLSIVRQLLPDSPRSTRNIPDRAPFGRKAQVLRFAPKWVQSKSEAYQGRQTSILAPHTVSPARPSGGRTTETPRTARYLLVHGARPMLEPRRIAGEPDCRPCAEASAATTDEGVGIIYGTS
jgi:hypothetical protein